MACTTGCPTKDCGSYAECLRGKRARVAYCNTAGGMDLTTQKNWDRDLDAYRDARRQGIQPSSSSRQSVDAAVQISNETGQAFQA